jgi:CheY-like chemotaxis protein
MMPSSINWSRRAASDRHQPVEYRQVVLVVEDELIIAEVAAEVLEEAGFDVLIVASAEEAEVILEKENVDVLFTDINLGRMDGITLANRARLRQADLAIVFASGRSRKLHGDPDMKGAAFLAKPYRFKDMLSAVEQAVASPKSTQ